MSHEKYEDYQDCIAACHACIVACNHFEACALQEPDISQMRTAIGLASDCSQLCGVAVALMSGGSPFTAPACELCAQACEACALECIEEDQDYSQQCAEACRLCSQACGLAARVH
jgi:pyridoxal/pyridoxine/pyridoxamine kinase